MNGEEAVGEEEMGLGEEGGGRRRAVRPCGAGREAPAAPATEDCDCEEVRAMGMLRLRRRLGIVRARVWGKVSVDSTLCWISSLTRAGWEGEESFRDDERHMATKRGSLEVCNVDGTGARLK